MHGWTVRPEVFEAGYKKLNELALQVITHYRDVLRHVTVVDMCGGHTHSCALTVPGAVRAATPARVACAAACPLVAALDHGHGLSSHLRRRTVDLRGPV